jgi:hypothetical protein
MILHLRPSGIGSAAGPATGRIDGGIMDLGDCWDFAFAIDDEPWEAKDG